MRNNQTLKQRVIKCKITKIQEAQGEVRMEQKKKHRMQHWQYISTYLLLFDIIAINFSYFLAIWLRFDFHFSAIPDYYLSAFLHFAPIYTVFTLACFQFLKLYNSLWVFASFSELNRLLLSSVITTVFHILGITVLFERMPISYFMIGSVAQFFFTTAARFSYRYITLLYSQKQKRSESKKNVMIIGAGSSGQQILREINSSDKLDYKVCCFIDDNPNKLGRFVSNVKIVGGREHILSAAKEYHIDQIMLAMPSAAPYVRRDILNICKETDCELMSLPGLYQLASGQVSLSKMKPVAIEDLLGRDAIKVDMTEIFHFIQGKTILVTGGGGSIGSELCRQIAAHHPKQLIIFDIYENNAYDIEQELKRKYGDTLNLVTLIGSVRDTERVDMVFEQYRPQLVFHAAAHKHVPLMESSPNEAIKNNVFGTYKVAHAALRYHAERFVLISTDKAVNPTNIMGASKRICEMIIQSMDAVASEGKADELPLFAGHQEQKEIDWSVFSQMTPQQHGDTQATQFVAVRFGNVLGSNGSVVPLFKKQIEAGEPVTVTHPDIIRYFMTIPEAVSLVLQAGTYAKGGEIFVLDMGQPVKIVDLAKNLIRLSGYEPDVDIKISFTGLRPGEKLYEEKLMDEEELRKTDNQLIHIGKPLEFDMGQFFQQLEKLAFAAYHNDENIAQDVREIVTTYHPMNNGRDQ